MEERRRIFERVSHVLDDREKLALDMRFGVSGPRSTLSDIGKIFGVTRERARQYIKIARQQLGEENWKEIVRLYPEPISDSAKKREETRRRNLVREYMRSLRKKDTIQYSEVHEMLEIPMPEHRGSNVYIYDEMQSCRAFLDDYGVKRFGMRYNYCSRCDEVKPMDEFYRSEDGKRIYQFCKACNTERCVTYFQAHAKEIAARQRARVARNPEAAREAVRRYQERKKLGISIRPRRVRTTAN